MSGPHPSEFIVEEMIARGWSADDLAHRMCAGEKDGAYEYQLNRLALDFYCEIGPEEPLMRLGVTADALARAFDVSPDYLRNLEAQWLAASPCDPGGTAGGAA